MLPEVHVALLLSEQIQQGLLVLDLVVGGPWRPRACLKV